MTSTAANRFALTADIALATDAFVMLQYDGTSSRWRAVSGGGSGGGSGSSLGNYSGSGDLVSITNADGTNRVLYFPAGFVTSSFFIGDGGASLTHTTALEGYYNIGIGWRCLTNIRKGSYNTFCGFEAGQDIYDNNYNTGFGEAAQIYNVSGNGNTTIGWKAGLGTTGVGLGNYNTAGGYGALLNPSSAVANNTAWGSFTLADAAFSGNSNVCIGYGAGYQFTSAFNNIVITSSGTGMGITTGDYNTIIGTYTSPSSSLSNNIVLADGQGNVRAQCDNTGIWTGIQPRGWIAGLNLANNGTDATNDIDIAEGTCRNAANTGDMTLAATLTKQLDAAWAVGTNAGGRDTGSIANGTWHVWLIKRSDTGVVDALFSLSASAPTMPTNYDQKRRIGSILRESGAIVAFVQDGDEFRRKVGVQDVATTNPGTSAVTSTLSVPTGIRVYAYLMIHLQAASAAARIIVTDLDFTDASPNASTGAVGSHTGGNSAQDGRTSDWIRTNTSGQVRYRLDSSDASTAVYINTHGWRDRRGRGG